MKKIISFIFGIALAIPLLLSQGNQSPNILLINSRSSFEQKDYNLAIERAKEAYAMAAKGNDKLYMGMSLQSEARALISKPKKIKANRKRAKLILVQSLDLLSGSEFQENRITSLKLLIKLAGLTKDKEGAKRYQLLINEVNNLIEKTKSEEQLEAKAVELEAKASQLSYHASTLTEQVDNLAVQKIELSKKIRKLNEDQLQSELLIALQKNRADSLSFQSEIDAFTMAQSEMKLAEQASKMELQKNELELQSSKKKMYSAFLAMLLIGIAALGFRFYGMKKHNFELKTKNDIIEAERAKSEELLLNILPSVVADELKINGVAKARRYEKATVLFTDFVNFSGISKDLSAEVIVKMLDRYFKLFDEVITRYRLEKIKTIGDAYMCVGGLPNTKTGTPSEVVNAAIEIQNILEEKKAEAIARKEPYFEARIGIHTGPLVAGVVGSKKFAFDIWGDTVNIASRIESGSLPGKVNISAATYKLIKDEFACESRGKLPIKNIGEIGMYFVKGVA